MQTSPFQNVTIIMIIDYAFNCKMHSVVCGVARLSYDIHCLETDHMFIVCKMFNCKVTSDNKCEIEIVMTTSTSE